MNWKKIGIVIGILLILSVIGYYGLTKLVLCGKAGEGGPNYSLGPNNPFRDCCLGLDALPWKSIYNSDCTQKDIDGWGTICSDCGNGICESWESKCTCAEDCFEEVGCRDIDYGCSIDDLPCCKGLVEKGACDTIEGMCACMDCGSICVPCGNGVCDDNENECNCPEDCGECRTVDDECTIEDTPCCGGLKSTGLCFPEEGGCVCANCGSICLDCGNGVCDDGENECNCEIDCE